MSEARAAEVRRLAGILILAFLFGLAIGHALLAVALTLGVYVSWHLFNLFRFHKWLSSGPSGDPPVATGIWGDVFEHTYRMQKRHKRRKKQLQSIVNQFQESTAAMPDATVVLDAAGHINWFNKAAKELLGLRPQDKGSRIDNLLRYPAFTDYLLKGDYGDAMELAAPADDRLILSVRIVPYGNEQRLLIARDVTRLQKLERMRRDFVTNVSHELRTPLTVLSGYLESLEEDQAAEEHWRRAVATMSQQTSRMRHIVEDLLLLSRLETGQCNDDPQPVAVRTLLSTIREDALALSGRQHHIELEADDSLFLSGNEKELHSAFSNIVFNAVKYTPPGGEIHMCWAGDENGAHFSVRDTGVGIPRPHIPRLTERFYRVDVGRSREKGGTGLGLAIVKHVLNRHDAQLSVESEPGQGSIFTCRFPARRTVVGGERKMQPQINAN